jgi:thiol-disulfide isomerase/thioredoxin
LSRVPGRGRLVAVAIWLGGVIVIGLVVAHLASAGPTTSFGSTSSAGPADPVGRIQAIPAADRKPAAALAGPLLGGGTFDPAAYAGHVLVVNAWASWCTPCKAELPAMRRLATATYPAAVRFLGIDVEEASMGDGQAMVRRYAVPYPSLYDEDKTIYAALAPPIMAASGVPGTIVIDARGRVAATILGGVPEAALSAYLSQLAAEPR